MPEPLPMTTSECERLLAAGVVGRVAVCTPQGPHVVPVNYRVLDGALVIRTSPYSVVGTHGRDAVVAFEVDEVDVTREEGWSVLARGRAVAVTDPDEISAIRTSWSAPPWALGVRNLYLRLRWAELTGRRLTSASVPTSP